jgi:DNA ligase D-like protein (predicted ligase)/DNA ligase D-like protein (predicted polymerase)/DNA ligase D-like protein (predicted 3'-phosphoesterase)
VPTDFIYTQIDDRKLKLSNPSKVLFPQAKIIKAEVIQYMLQVAEHMLLHIYNRPLTLIRFPDGIDGKRFYSKNKPKWTPPWINSTCFPDDDKNQYILATEKATLAWIGNLAGLEIHPMNVRASRLSHPDQFVFDLDPSAEVDFPALKELAADLKIYLEDHGYTPFIKTSGSKGLHIYVPIRPDFPQPIVFQSVKNLACEYVKNHSKSTTLKISKTQRKGKVLLDIYRNHKAQSCVAPYSLRGKSGAPVSTPFPWELLADLPHSMYWNMNNISAHLEKYGDPWALIKNFAVPLHDQKSQHPVPALKEYEAKRDFSKTIEPEAHNAPPTSGQDYVIQLHNASNLHYDLRLEHNGTLQSWAIPKGLPYKTGIKRLAIRTEDHPLKYLTFEGSIPKGQYGGGEMWILDSGIYKTIKRTEKKIHFRLKGGQMDGEFIIYNSKKDQWLLERKVGDKIDINDFLSPMLATTGSKIPSPSDYDYEVKWDGIRAIFKLEAGEMTIYSRNGNDITDKFPEITSKAASIEAELAIMDGEIVYLDAEGRPDFSKVVGRIHLTGEKAIKNASLEKAATAMLFDLLYFDGLDCRKKNIERRRAWLETILTVHSRIRFSESFSDGQALFDGVTTHGIEGIMCKKKGSTYQSGTRSSSWLKVKVRKEDSAIVIGWSEGQGDRAGLIGAFHLAKKEKDSWKYVGKVGTGFDMDLLRNLSSMIQPLEETEKPVDVVIEEPQRTHWVIPKYRIDLEYASMSSNDTYREPVFKGISEVMMD